MNKEQYKIEILRLKTKHEKEIIELIKKYCLENNSYKVGDVFKDHMGSILIEKIGFHLDQNSPCCRYFGAILNKDGSITKRKDNARFAFQLNETK
jgi:hypothetical protein